MFVVVPKLLSKVLKPTATSSGISKKIVCCIVQIILERGLQRIMLRLSIIWRSSVLRKCMKNKLKVK